MLQAPYGSPPDVWRQLLQRLVMQAAAKAGLAEDSARQAVAAMLDGVEAPTDSVIEAARVLILALPQAAAANAVATDPAGVGSSNDS